MRCTDKAKLVAKKLSFDFGNLPEEKLMCAIIEQALRDAVDESCSIDTKICAREYLRGRIIHAELAGIEAGRVRQLIKLANLFNI